MKIYYIYHIPGVKIGCTCQLQKRMADQGFTSWEILEEHTCMYVASDREQELQRQYGYTIDIIPYWKSLENRFKWNDATRKKIWLDHEACSRGGKIGGAKTGAENGKVNRVLTKEDAREIRKRKFSQRKLAKMYGVSRSTICRIQYNLTYVDA